MKRMENREEYFRMAKLMPTMVSFESRGLRWPAVLAPMTSRPTEASTSFIVMSVCDRRVEESLEVEYSAGRSIRLSSTQFPSCRALYDFVICSSTKTGLKMFRCTSISASDKETL